MKRLWYSARGYILRQTRRWKTEGKRRWQLLANNDNDILSKFPQVPRPSTTSSSANPLEKATRLLVVRLDDIGDYLLFRAQLQRLCQDCAQRGIAVSLLGNIVWRDLSLALDGAGCANTLWIDKPRFLKDTVYRTSILSEVRAQQFEVVLCPAFNRHAFLDDIVARVSGANRKVAWATLSVAWEYSRPALPQSTSIYTDLVRVPNGFLSEIELNSHYMAKIVTQPALPRQHAWSSLHAICSKTELPISLKFPLVALVPGGGAASKRWATKRWAALVADLHRQHPNLSFVVVGGASDVGRAQEIVAKCHAIIGSSNAKNNQELIVNLAGKTSLLSLAALLSRARLVISNDTSAAHFAANLSIPTIVLLNGNHFGRFFPYPQLQAEHITCLYTGEFKNIVAKKGREALWDWPGLTLLNEITSTEVSYHANKILGKSIPRNLVPPNLA